VSRACPEPVTGGRDASRRQLIPPTVYQEIRLLRDTAGQFLGGGPFLGPYGSGSNLQASGQVGA